MSYVKQNFVDGNVLTAAELNHIEDGIAAVEVDAAATKKEIDTLKKSKAEIDDTTIDGDTWSSKHIVDMLCPKVEKSGTLVQMDGLVEGYPLGVKVSWEPAQEGSGDPSPENIRPIKGRTEVKVERCGKNLLKNKGNKTISGIEWTFDDQGLISIKGTIEQNLSDYFFWGGTVENSEAFTTHVDLVLSSNYITNDSNCIFGVRSDAGLLQNGGRLNKVSIPSGTRIYGVFMRVLNATVDYSGIYAQLELGSTVTPYEPYTGSTTDITLPSTVYGGEVDAVRGEGQEIWKLVTLDGTEAWETWGVNAKNDAVTGFYTYGINDYDVEEKLGKCSHNAQDKPGTWGGGSIGIGFSTTGPKRYFIYNVPTAILSDISNSAAAIKSLKAYFAAQLAAGTPVQVAYRLADPKPFTAAGGAAIPALSGTNTVLTDADSVTVISKADPIQTVSKLSERIAALETAAIPAHN